MITICKPIEDVAKLTGKVKYDPDRSYRLCDHCVTLETEEGTLLYQTLTAELLLLDEREARLLSSLPGSIPEELTELLSKRFIVSADFDEKLFCDQLRDVVSLIKQGDGAITSYTVFTTTDCNARCFYCYEKGRSRVPMSQETALATADYIAAHCGGKSVSLHWFGGEPLYNYPVIDTITNALREKGVEYRSSMISNSYLFDEELVKKAKEDWLLKKIQITLDGTEQVYNRRKAFIYREGSAYKRVLRNIGLLLDADVHVTVRLNLDMNNYGDLIALVDELAEKFGTDKKLTVYDHVIFETAEENRTAEKRRELYRASDELTEHINALGLGTKSGVSRSFRMNHCMADSASTATVLPDGSLGKCEHYSESEFWGNVRSDEADTEMLESWKKRMSALPECKTCFFYPKCIRLDKCFNQKDYCDAEYAEQEKRAVQRQMLNSFEKYKKKIQTEDEPAEPDC